MTGFIIGLAIGAMCGVVITTLCVAASNNDKHISEENANE